MQVGLPSSSYFPLCRAIAHERRIGDSNWMTKPHLESRRSVSLLCFRDASGLCLPRARSVLQMDDLGE
jgi:hypothetical protein